MTSALIVVPVVRSPDAENRQASRSPRSRQAEAVGLAEAIGLAVASVDIVNLEKIVPATFIGSGKGQEFAARMQEGEIDIAIFDCTLSPVQQRNLERMLGAKVLDRTGLILEIFGERAKTREGVIQVELAHLNYQRGRLVRSWTHLERQRGGAGFLGGPGETQIEADRRLLREKITRLENQLKRVKRTRELHRAKRRKVPFPIIALVGYTNAGKSTLFNRLTGAKTHSADMLFATLDPTLRKIRLPMGTVALLSDTVGFISDLPTHLVAAFRATLEEVVEADLILHIRNIADEDTQAQADDVCDILSQLGINPENPDRIIEVLNKIDLLDRTDNPLPILSENNVDAVASVPVSAVTGEGIDVLLMQIEKTLAGDVETVRTHIGPADHDVTSWMHEFGEILMRKNNDDGSADIAFKATEERVKELRSELSKRDGSFIRDLE